MGGVFQDIDFDSFDTSVLDGGSSDGGSISSSQSDDGKKGLNLDFLNGIDFSGIQKGINNFTGGLEPIKSEVAPSQSMIYLILGILGFLIITKK
jgi:hypothetical protein